MIAVGNIPPAARLQCVSERHERIERIIISKEGVDIPGVVVQAVVYRTKLKQFGVRLSCETASAIAPMYDLRISQNHLRT